MAPLDLASVPLGSTVRLVVAHLDKTEHAWLSAVGLHEGEELIVLRHAIASGPLHVRTSSGGEFAVGRELAAKLEVVPVTR